MTMWPPRSSDEAPCPRSAEPFCAGPGLRREPDIRTRLLVDLAVTLDPGEERTRLLREAAALNGNLVAMATAALCLRQG